MNIKLKDTYVNSGVITNDELNLTRNGQTITLFDNIQNITYSSLCTLVANAELATGQFYRITDYVTTTTQSDTQSAGHAFDVIVLALNSWTLSDNAWAIMNESNVYDVTFADGVTKRCYLYFNDEDDDCNVVLYEDITKGISLGYGSEDFIELNYVDKTAEIIMSYNEGTDGFIDLAMPNVQYNYFQNSKLGSWEIKYSLSNDVDRYAWADTTNGKGVIYYMKDEYGNECAYDFKNIQFKRKLSAGVLNTTSGTDTYVYTFNLYNTSNSTISDASIDGNRLTNSSSNYPGVFSNKIGALSRTAGGYGTASSNQFSFCLSNNVFLMRGASGSFDGCYCNEIAANNRNITFGKDAAYNKIDSYCNSSVFGDGCKRNEIGVLSYSCTFGNNCLANTLGTDCSNTVLGDGCNYNTFLNKCDSNTLGANCRKNNFGHNSNTNTLGSNCESNEFGNESISNNLANYCSYNTFGNFCQIITLNKQYIQHCTFEDYNYKLTLTSTQTTNSGNILRNVTVEKFCGPFNAQNVHTISHNTVNDRFLTHYRPQNSVVVSEDVGV